MVRELEGPVCLYLNFPIEFRFLSRDSGDVICIVPFLDLEVGADDLESVMDLAVRTIRAMTYAFQTCDVAALSSQEEIQRTLFLEAVDIHRTFEMISPSVH